MTQNPNLKILLAEDNEINQRIMTLTFRQMGVKCDIASNGEEALKKHKEIHYDLILMDLQMPIMNGTEATRLIRNFEKETNHKSPAYIVALTGNDISDKKEDCIEAGMDDFIEKPLHQKVLRQLLSRWNIC